MLVSRYLLRKEDTIKAHKLVVSESIPVDSMEDPLNMLMGIIDKHPKLWWAIYWDPEDEMMVCVEGYEYTGPPHFKT